MSVGDESEQLTYGQRKMQSKAKPLVKIRHEQMMSTYMSCDKHVETTL